MEIMEEFQKDTMETILRLVSGMIRQGYGKDDSETVTEFVRSDYAFGDFLSKLRY